VVCGLENSSLGLDVFIMSGHLWCLLNLVGFGGGRWMGESEVWEGGEQRGQGPGGTVAQIGAIANN